MRPLCSAHGCGNLAMLKRTDKKTGKVYYRKKCQRHVREQYGRPVTNSERRAASASFRETQKRAKKRYSKKTSKRRSARRRRSNKRWAIQYLGGKCMNPGCPLPGGLVASVAIFDFHHRDATKKDSEISVMLRTKSHKAIATELDQCDLLCCFCHRMVHSKPELAYTLP